MRFISLRTTLLIITSLFCGVAFATTASTTAETTATTQAIGVDPETSAETPAPTLFEAGAGETSAAAITPVITLKGDPVAGKAKSEPCVACHNVDGNSPIPMYPKIAGQYEAYLVESLAEFRQGPQGIRNNPIMYGIVAHLSDQDIVDLAAYFASQKQTVGMVDPQYLALGERIYRGGNDQVAACIACHGPKGEGNSLANFPRIGGQNAEYIVSQLHAFRSGARGPGPNSMMKDVADRMTDEEINAVSSYISGLH